VGRIPKKKSPSDLVEFLADPSPFCAGTLPPDELLCNLSILCKAGYSNKKVPIGLTSEELAQDISLLYRQAESPLKFFTRGWVHGDMTDEDAESVAPAYWQHLDAIDLPQTVRNLATLNPHDAYILDVENEPHANFLRLRLRCGDLQVGYFDASLSFSGVTIAPEQAAILANARRPAEIEILYDEIDCAESGAFEYRLLLHPVGQVAFYFTDVAIARHPVADRRAV
jgi:hypothetical protein